MTGSDFCFRSEEPAASAEAARRLASALPDSGLVLLLVGPLGAGKTLFVQGLADGLGVDPAQVSSPTFSIVNEYPLGGRRRLVHVDLYRVESEADLEHVGFLDLLDSGTVLAAEWGDRFPQAFPRDCLELSIQRAGDDGASASVRDFGVTAHGPCSQAVARDWRAALRRAAPSGLKLGEPGSNGPASDESGLEERVE